MSAPGLALTRISHQPSAAASDAPHPTVFSHFGVLDVLSSTTPRPSDRKPHWARRLAALATKAGEKCGLAIITFVACTAFAQAPVPVAERVVTERNLATRVTLFSNGAVVVSMRRDGKQDFMRRITLPDDQYMVYLVTFQKSAEELGKEPISSGVNTSTASVRLTLHVGPEAPRLLRFSPMAVVSLPLSRIQGALDDLERIVLEASPSSEEIRNWTPRPGDRVQLMTGGFARVVEVWPEGIVVLEHDSTFIREMVSPDVLDQVILHIVDPQP